MRAANPVSVVRVLHAPVSVVRVLHAAKAVRSWIGGAAVVLALMLASPGIRVSHAEDDFSYDPALEPGAVQQAAAAIPQRAAAANPRALPLDFSQPGATCAARSGPAVVPTARALQGMPLLIADGTDADRGLNSLNSRGYNIGKTEPSAGLQKLLFEVERQAH